MCGRFSLSKPAEAAERFGFTEWHDVRVEPRFNIAPTQEVLIVVEHTPRLAIWGFTPHWLQEDGRRRAPPINARAETLDRNPMFREALLARRCLVVADGFYEWRAGMPMYIRLKGAGVFGFAGLWAPGKAGGPPSVAIVTTRPNDLVASIHNRMPVILRVEDEAAWLDPRQKDLERLTAMLSPLDADRMEAYPVAPLVNAFQNEGPELILPLAPERGDVVQPALPF